MKNPFLSLFFLLSFFAVSFFDLHAQVRAGEDPAPFKAETDQIDVPADLKALIRESRKHIRDGDDKAKTQAILKRNQQREQKAQEYYRQGQRLTAKGLLDEAREYYENAIKITEHPEMRNYIKESEVRRKRMEAALARATTERQRIKAREARDILLKIASVYEQAVASFKLQQLDQAREQFLFVEKNSPDYKAVRCYLQIVEQDIRQARRRASLGSGQGQDVEWVVPDFRASEEYLGSEKKTSFGSSALAVADNSGDPSQSGLSAEEAAREKDLRQQNEQKMQQADELFLQAMDLYQRGLLIEAKEKFIVVDQNVPDYKSARSYLKRIDDDIAVLVMARRKNQDLAVQKQELVELKEIRDRAEDVYNKAITAYDNKDFQTARSFFRETEDVFPNYKKTSYFLGRIDEDIRRQEEETRRAGLEKQASGVYAQAVALYGAEQFEEAKNKFLDVAGLIADYRQTASYLERIDDDIIRKKETTLNEVRARQSEILYNQAVSLYRNEEFEQAKERFLELEVVSPNYKEAARYLSMIDQDIFRKNEEISQQLKADQAEEIYRQALALYKVGDFVSAKEKFVRIEVIYPDYKDTARYLAGIDEDIQRKKNELERQARAAQAEPLYRQAIELYRAQEFSEARKKFQQVQVIYPEYKDTVRYLSRVDEDIRILEDRLARMEKVRFCERSYAEALSFYSGRSFEEAKNKFLEVAALDPGYKNTKGYLSRIDGDIRQEKERQRRLAQEEKAEPLYSEAIDLYHNKKDFVSAKGLFIDVARILPDHKKTKYYLSRIDKDIREQNAEFEKQRLARAEALYRQAADFLAEKQDIDAYQRLMELEAYYPDYKAARQQMENLKQAFAARGIILTPAGMGEEAIAENKEKPVEDLALDSYQEAVFLLKQGKNSAAREKFAQLDQQYPDYRSTRQYLADIDAQDVRIQQKAARQKEREELAQKRAQERELRRQADALYRQGVGAFRAKDYAVSRASFNELNSLMPGYKDVGQYLDRVDRAEQEARLANEPVAAEYLQAVDLFKENEAQALEKFQEIEKSYPDYRDTRRYLSLIRKAESERQIAELRKKEKEELAQKKAQERELHGKANMLYRQGVAAFRAKDYPVSQGFFKELQDILPGYRDVVQYLNRIDEAETLAAQETEASGQGVVPDQEISPEAYQDKTAQAEKLYSQALSLYRARRYDDAQVKFDAAGAILPGYKSIDEYKGLIAKNKEGKSPEDLRQEAAAVQDLARSSADLFRQIKALSAEKEMSGVARTFARIDRVISNLEKEQERIARDIERQEQEAREAAEKIAREQKASMADADILPVGSDIKKEDPWVGEERTERQIKEELEKKRQEEKARERELQEQKKNEEREQKLKIETLYRQVTDLFRSKQYTQAKDVLIELQKISSGYRDSDQYMLRIEKALEEETLLAEEAQDQEAITRLAEKANEINQEALHSSQERDFIGLQAKFSDLSGLLKEIQIIRSRMQLRRERFTASWQDRLKSSQEKMQTAEKIRKMRQAAEQEEIREKSRKFFREGEMFYANGDYPQAKVKFLEAAQIDPHLKAARTYINRIDRILSRRDYEERRSRMDKERREIERRQEGAADKSLADTVTDPERAKTVYEEGIVLYKAKRYKEARIKFEEAAQTDDVRQRRKAERYLKLVEKALETERQQAERVRSEQEKRYLEARRAEDALAWSPDLQHRTGGALSRSPDEMADDVAVQRQLEIRMIEQQNAAERERMLSQKEETVQKGVSAQKVESKKFGRIARQERLKPVTEKVINKEVRKELQKTEPVDVEAAKEDPVIEKVREEPARKKVSRFKKTRETAVPETVTGRDYQKVLQKRARASAFDVRETRKFQKIAAEERARAKREERQLAALNREHKNLLIERKRLAERALPQEDKAVLDTVKVLPEPKKIVEKKKPAREKKERLPKVSRTAPVSEEEVSVVLDDRQAAEREKERLLTIAAEKEKRLLQQQRAAVQKDFEEGVSRLYNDAVVLFKKKLFEESREVFQEVQGLIPGYKKTDVYLKQISQKLPVR